MSELTYYYGQRGPGAKPPAFPFNSNDYYLEANMYYEDEHSRAVKALEDGSTPGKSLSEIIEYWRAKINSRLYNTYPPLMANMIDTYNYLLVLAQLENLEGLRSKSGPVNNGAKEIVSPGQGAPRSEPTERQGIIGEPSPE